MDAAHHWDRAYGEGERTRSWFESAPVGSLRMLQLAGVSPADSVIDAGGGASTLVDALLERGFDDVTVLDISATGIQAAQRRLGPSAARVQWIVADLRDWRPSRTYQVWHDRAVLHFLTADADRQSYLDTLTASTAAGAAAIFATFAPDGPRRCSGLPVAHYSAHDLAALLGDRWTSVVDDREEHVTPAGAVQPFVWAVFRRTA
ncbi:MAG TPA: class I SAM-dependent methyltransferase [Micromonospora sp.]|nr:class I SAM-dependent methyltransferase [Micromonospora sp.]